MELNFKSLEERGLHVIKIGINNVIVVIVIVASISSPLRQK